MCFWENLLFYFDKVVDFLLQLELILNLIFHFYFFILFWGFVKKAEILKKLFLEFQNGDDKDYQSISHFHKIKNSSFHEQFIYCMQNWIESNSLQFQFNSSHPLSKRTIFSSIMPFLMTLALDQIVLFWCSDLNQ